MLLDLDSAQNWTRPILLLHGIKHCFRDREDHRPGMFDHLLPRNPACSFIIIIIKPTKKISFKGLNVQLYDDLAQKLE
jgi:hypothetical protein